MKTALRPGERMIQAGPANLQRSIETVGGRVYLTDQRLVFESHAFNVQTGATEIELSDIRSLEPSWTRFLGLLPIFPNSLSIHTQQGEAYHLVLWGRTAWAAAISSAMQRDDKGA